MDRRAFIAGTVALLAAAPAVGAQPGRLPAVGMLMGGAKANGGFIDTFRREMQALGWGEGRNVRYVFAWAEERNDRLAVLAAELVAQPVDVFVSTSGDPGIRAAQRATSAIPIVGLADDMVGSALVASMARPGANTTGVSILASELDAKRLALLHEAAPKARLVGVLVDPTTVATLPQVEKAARDLGIQLVTRPVKARDEVGRALDGMIAARVGAVNVLASPVLNRLHRFIMDRMRQARLPAIYQWPEVAEEGGLLAYGPRLVGAYRQVAGLVDKILRGAKPADLPVEQPTKFELVINLNTAKALGLTIPPAVLARADEVIQ